MTTIETALSLSALVTVAAAIVAGIATIAAYITAVDTAGAAARAHAIGVESVSYTHLTLPTKA